MPGNDEQNDKTSKGKPGRLSRYDEGYREGHSVGTLEGREQGLKEGQAAGFRTGYTRGLTEGMKFFVVRFLYILEQDIVAKNQMLIDIKRAMRGLTPPERIDVPYTTRRMSWRDEFENLFDLRGVHIPEPEQVGMGRRVHTESEWVNFGLETPADEVRECQ